MEDAAIIELYWERSEAAIEETAEKYGNYCAKIAVNILENREDADECVNDTYMKVWNAIPPQRPAAFPAFLGRITRNLALDRFRAQNAGKRGGGGTALLLSELEECVPDRGNVEAACEEGAIAKAIESFLGGLDPEHRILFMRRYWYADSISAIAAQFWMSESKVKSILFRTRHKLKVYLERKGITV